ncbi:restriction endonuclease subunit S [Flagellimonas flava]|uniref:restriction endonuclease subunit S n=1 Tax=Flagellimonas flava TaxID=570519 RepID=UPI003D660241
MSGRKATTNIIPGRIALSVGKPDKTIPKGWKWRLLSDIAQLATGHTPSRKKPEYWNGEIPWMAVGDASKHNGSKIYETKEYTNELGIANSAAVLLPENTVCLSRTASIGYVILLGRPMATSQGFVNWICSKQLNPRFLQMIFLVENQFLYEISEGTAHTTIYFPEVKAFNISMPSRSEQDRIVAKVDSLMAKVDVMQKSLERIPQLLKDFRQQFLTQAVTGKLTEEWRKTKGKASWKKQTLKESTFEIFDGPFGSNLKTKDYISEGIQVVRLENVKAMYYDDSKKAFVSEEKYQSLSRNHLMEGDLLLSTFVADEIKATILPKSATPSINKSDVVCIRVNEEILLKEFCLFFLLSTEGQNQISSLAHGITRPRINTGNIKSLKPNIPTIIEQKKIVEIVYSFFKKVDVIEEEYQALKAKIETLPQAILQKAFKGELVEQLPTDVDAKELLKDIEKLEKKHAKRNRQLSL